MASRRLAVGVVVGSLLAASASACGEFDGYRRSAREREAGAEANPDDEEVGVTSGDERDAGADRAAPGGECTPVCTGKACGAPDGCDGICAVGSCPKDSHCTAGACIEDPEPRLVCHSGAASGLTCAKICGFFESKCTNGCFGGEVVGAHYDGDDCSQAVARTPIATCTEVIPLVGIESAHCCCL